MSTKIHVVEHDVDITTEVENPAEERARKARRRKLLIRLAIGAAGVATAVTIYEMAFASHHVSTDNAYVGADVAVVTPLVGGPVREVRVADTQQVSRGDVLVVLDDTDARIALARAEAQLALTERQVRGLVATNTGLDAQIAARVADLGRADAQLAAARSDLEKARIDLRRREALADTGSVSGEEVTASRNAFHMATAQLKAAQAAKAQALANRGAAIGSRDANHALIAGTTVDTHPEVLAARAARDQAKVDLERMVIRAPVDGIVSRRQVQVGQRVQPGEALMAVVPVGALYVDANFKEVQLANVHPGQPVTLQSDLYGGDVVYHGHVVGFSGGTGAAFAVVPAQNATGNWIKVVQRLPVRVALDPVELAAHPLRVGLSMTADIDLTR